MNKSKQKIYESILNRGFALSDDEYDSFLINNINDLGIADPKIRDELVYVVFCTWILNGYISKKALHEVLTILLSDNFIYFNIDSNLLKYAVKRTFSWLIIAAIVEYDNKSSFLAKRELRIVLSSIKSYFENEKVYTGYSSKYGWVHSIAHCADVILELLRSDNVSEKDKKSISLLIIKIITQTKEYFVYREEERLCKAIFSYKGNRKSFIVEHIQKLVECFKHNTRIEKHTYKNYHEYLKTCYFYSEVRKEKEGKKLCLKEISSFMYFDDIKKIST